MCDMHDRTTLWFDCECYMPDHAIRLSIDSDGQACLDIRFKKLSFFARLKNAMRYVLFSKRDFPVYGEIVLSKQSCLALSSALAASANKISDTQE